MSQRRAWILAAISLALVLYGLAMSYQSRSARFAKPGEVLYPQIVELETPRYAADAADLLRADAIAVKPALHWEQIDQYRISTEWDDGLLVLYPLQLIAVCGLAWTSRSRGYAVAAGVLIVLGAFCDWRENRHIFDILGQAVPLQTTVDTLRHWSLAKWGLDGAAWLCAAVALHRSIFSAAGIKHIQPWRVRFVTVAFFISGVLSLCGAASFVPAWDYRALLAEGVFFNALAVIGCVFRP